MQLQVSVCLKMAKLYYVKKLVLQASVKLELRKLEVGS